MTQKEITVLMVEPGKHPKVTTLKDDLDSLQKAVSIGADYQGLIEFVSLGNGDCIMCNEEGKLIGLDGNRRLGDDILVGVFYIMSENEDGELLFLSERKIKLYGASSSSCKGCKCSSWATGRRVVGLNRQNTGPCQSMDRRSKGARSPQVPPRPPKRQLQGCLFFC